MRIAITAAWLWAELRKPRDRAADFADAKVLGLTLRLSPNGVAAWSTRRLLPDGRYTRVALGLFPATGIAEARQRALQTQGALQGGADPVSLKRAAKAKAKADKARPTVADCWREYAHAKATSEQWGPAHARNADLFFSRGVAPVLGIRALADITRADWIRVITVEGKKGQGAKATALRLIRGFDAYSETAGWIERAVLPRKAGYWRRPAHPGSTHLVTATSSQSGMQPPISGRRRASTSAC